PYRTSSLPAPWPASQDTCYRASMPARPLRTAVLRSVPGTIMDREFFGWACWHRPSVAKVRHGIEIVVDVQTVRGLEEQHEHVDISQGHIGNGHEQCAPW